MQQKNLMPISEYYDIEHSTSIEIKSLHKYLKKASLSAPIYFKWARGESNHWPRPYEGRALTNWATGPVYMAEL